MAAKKKSTNTEYLEAQAAVVKSSLEGMAQSEVFKVAVEVGYLTALADGGEDAVERSALVDAIEGLSTGLVIEWEIETILAEVWHAIQTEGSDARIVSVGKKLKELGAAEAGLLIGAIVSHASGGVDKKEAVVLEKIGAAAGVPKAQVVSIVKKSRV